MKSPPLHVVAPLALALGCATAYGQICSSEKFESPDSQQEFLAHHYGLIVHLDVDAEYAHFLQATHFVEGQSEAQRQDLLRDQVKILTAAKEQRLAGTRFHIDANLELGPDVVIRVQEWQDVCELARNPHVKFIWFNRPIHLT